MVVTLEERFRFALARSGLSARKLSEAAKLSPSYLAYVFRTLRQDPTGAPFSLENVRAVARAAGVSPRWLIDGTGSPDDPERAELPAPSMDVHFVARPLFGSLPDWPHMLARAKELVSLPAWIWERIETMAPILSATPTPVMIAELATWIHRHERTVLSAEDPTTAHRPKT